MNDPDEAKTWADEDDAAWEERGEFGDTGKQAELINHTFRLDSVRYLEYDWEGKTKETFIGTIALNGETETKEYWLGGRFVMDRINKLIDSDSLPMFLSLIRDVSKKGQPYRLLPGQAELPENATPPPTPATDSQSNHPHRDTLVKFCKDNKLVRDNGTPNAAQVLELLGVTVNPMAPPSEAFATYVADTKKRKKLDATDDAYKVVLEELVLAMATKKGKTKAPEPEPSPFE